MVVNETVGEYKNGSKVMSLPGVQVEKGPSEVGGVLVTMPRDRGEKVWYEDAATARHNIRVWAASEVGYYNVARLAIHWEGVEPPATSPAPEVK